LRTNTTFNSKVDLRMVRVELQS